MSKNYFEEIKNNPKIGVIGLGYVGLPLAVELAKKHQVIGFDVNQTRVDELNNGVDKTLEITGGQLSSLPNLNITSKEALLGSVNFYIVTVPTPIDKSKQPDLGPIKGATRMLSKMISKGDIIVYESTVYPGVTDEICATLLEQGSGLIFNKDFFLGYSPERINPGDKEHVLTEIVKVVSGSTPETLDTVDHIYCSIINAGTHRASTIKVAEASKVIENSQRDINIAFMNELSKIFNLLNINTYDVLEAANTKWNFLPFKPGLVGGHCIGVDPYYLAQKAQENGYHPEIILAGRRLNDGMGNYVASEIVKCMIKKNIPVNGSKVLILGITFKENCPDIRNTKVVDLANALKDFGANIMIHDPWADEDEVMLEYSLKSTKSAPIDRFDALVLAVSHNEFNKLDYSSLKNNNSIIYDVKSFIKIENIDGSL